MKRTLIILGVCVLAGYPAICNGDELGEKAHFVLRAFQAACEKLATGAFEMSGSRDVLQAESDDQDGVEYSGEINGFYAFDFEKEWLRYDVHLPGAVAGIPSSSIGSPDDPSSDLNGLKYNTTTMKLNSVRQSDYFSRFVSSTPTIRTSVPLFAADADWDGGNDKVFCLFDVRCLGAVGFAQFEHHPGHFTLSRLVDELLSYPVERMDEQGSLTILHLKGPGVLLIELHIDTAQGYMPTFCQITGAGRDEVETTRTSWEERDDVWVPVFFLTEWLDFPEIGDIQRYQFHLDWSHVNAALPERFFDYQAFPDVPNGTRVVDQRGPEPRHIGTWEDGAFVAAAPSPQMLMGKERRLPWWVKVNVVVIILLIVAALWVKRNKNAAGKTESASSNASQ